VYDAAVVNPLDATMLPPSPDGLVVNLYQYCGVFPSVSDGGAVTVNTGGVVTTDPDTGETPDCATAGINDWYVIDRLDVNALYVYDPGDSAPCNIHVPLAKPCDVHCWYAWVTSNVAEDPNDALANSWPRPSYDQAVADCADTVDATDVPPDKLRLNVADTTESTFTNGA
jgi:hypothetical protein